MDRVEKARALIQGILKARVLIRHRIQEELRARDMDISFEMLQIFSCLSQKQGLTQQQIADTVFKDKASLTYLINSMESRGLVCREEDETDRRARRIYLSDKGREMVARLRPLLDSFYVSVCDILGKEQVEFGLGYVAAVHDAVREAEI